MQNSPGIGDITIAGKPLKGDALDYITSASIEMGIDQITQLTLAFDDPDFQ